MTERPISVPGSRLLKNLAIGSRLSLGFGILVVLTFLVIGLSLLAGAEATATIRSVTEVRQPTARAAFRAQGSLYRAVTNLRGYLLLGEPQFITNYRAAEQDFRQDLDNLQARAGNLGSEDQARLQAIQQAFSRWSVYPDRLFALHDDQMDREPAYALLNTRGTELGGEVLIDSNRLIEELARREPSRDNNTLLRDMSRFQGSFTALLSGLRGYVTTRNPLFRYYEYQVNLDINNEVWSRLMSQQAALDDNQRQILASIDQKRKAFLAQVPGEVFQIMQSPKWRLDLSLFAEEATPLSDEMQQRLRELTDSQQTALELDLSQGSTSLVNARIQTLVGGALVVLMGVILSILFRESITGPIRRLTHVAEQIRTGDLVIQAQVEAADEIGLLATTFNGMTAQLRQSLVQVNHEKTRANQLLEVVIPIGVALSAEKDYNRLIENILLEAKSFCHARAGVLYMRTEDNKLKFELVHNSTKGLFYGGTSGVEAPLQMLPLYDESGAPNHNFVSTYVVLNGVSVNLPTTTTGDGLHFSAMHQFNRQHDFDPISMLTIPLKNRSGEVLGAMQLIDAEHPETGEVIPFDPNLQQMMESFSLLAVAALEAYIREQSLRKEIRELRIEIDEVKRQQQVKSIVESDFFQNVRSKAQAIRARKHGTAPEAPGEPAEPAVEPHGEQVAVDRTSSEG